MPQAPASLLLPMRRFLIVAGLGLATLLPVATGLGWLLGGAPVGWGILLGLALPAAFFGVSVVVALATARMGSGPFAAVVLTSWVIKVIVLMVILAALREADFYAKPAFLVAFAVGVVGWLAAEWVVVTRTKTLYVEPEGDRL